MDALDAIHSRKSVRTYTGEPVSKEELETLVKAAMAAPTAVNRQPWSFIIVTDRKTLNTLADELPFAKMLAKAGAGIIVCAIPSKAHENSREFAVIDATLAGENILIAAEALGLGTVWTSVFPHEDRMTAVRRILNIPADVLPLNIIPVGHPGGAEKPKDKYKAENVRWEKW